MMMMKQILISLIRLGKMIRPMMLMIDDSDMMITMRVMLRWTLVDGDENCVVEDNYDDNIVII